MRVLFTVAELYPYVKTGGLGDVAAALPQALRAQDIDMRLMMPGYPALLEHLAGIETVKRCDSNFGADSARILRGRLPDGMVVYALDIPHFYHRAGPYVDENGKDWPDNHLRFGALCRASAEIAAVNDGWRPDVVHGNDWHCGLIPAYLQALQDAPPASMITIHNISYQGLFPEKVLQELEFPGDWPFHDFNFHGKFGFLKAGLLHADAITTVSPTYAREIQSEEHGCGLDHLLRLRSDDLKGILNGIDENVWNPASDKYLSANYSPKTLKDKQHNREALVALTGIRPAEGMPVFCVTSRLVHQKGLDFLLEAMPPFLRQGAALFVLGSGEHKLEEDFHQLARQFPDKVFSSTDYKEPSAHRIIAGADAILVPSRFEPCGLVQMYGLRYGTLPVVRKTGGLADSVSPETGFIFEEESSSALADALENTIATFRAPRQWTKMQREAMAHNFSWSSSARRYRQIYEHLQDQNEFPRVGRPATITA